VIILALSCFLATLSTFIRGHYFFIGDEWSGLVTLCEGNQLAWIFQSHLGHVYPVARLFFLIETKLFGDRHLYYQVLNCLMLTVNTLLLVRLLRKLSITWFYAIASSVLYTFNHAQAINVAWAGQSSVILCVTFILISNLLAFDFWTSKKMSRLYGSCVCCFLSAFCFGFGMISPAILIIFGVFLGVQRGWDWESEKKIVLHSMITLLVIAIAYVLCMRYQVPMSSFKSNYQDTVSSDFLKQIFTPGYAVFLLKGAFIAPYYYYFNLADSPPESLFPFAHPGVILACLSVGLILRSEPRFKKIGIYILLLFSYEVVVFALPGMVRHFINPQFVYFQHYQTFSMLAVVVFVGLLSNSARKTPYRSAYILIFACIAAASLYQSQKKIENWAGASEAGLMAFQAKYLELKSQLQSGTSFSEATLQSRIDLEVNNDLTNQQVLCVMDRVFR
jgi:hypothetical protein